MLTVLAMIPALLTSGEASSLTDILSMATELLSWVITSMTSIITFIGSNPLILIFMIITIVGFAVGMLMRIWHGVG